MITQIDQAAQLLTGKILEGGWVVGGKITNLNSDRGGVYSCCYEVLNGNRKGFLKAFDYSGAERIGEDPVEYMKDLLSAFALERKILEKCKTAKCKNVVELLDYGGISVPEAKQYPRVEYLILEYADNGDIQEAIDKNRVSMEWKLRSLHQLCNGLHQIHKLAISHNDIKPVNIVNNKNITKLSDFGSAIPLDDDPNNLPNHLKENITGTWAYAPPELLYGELHFDSVVKRIGCDLYLLGSMIVYYFTRRNMTSLIRSHLAPSLCWTKSQNYGNYQSLKSYLILAFEKALEEIRLEINDKTVEDKIILMIRYLCNPDVEKRGHLKNIQRVGSNYNLERFVTMFDVLARYYSIKNK